MAAVHLNALEDEPAPLAVVIPFPRVPAGHAEPGYGGLVAAEPGHAERGYGGLVAAGPGHGDLAAGGRGGGAPDAAAVAPAAVGRVGVEAWCWLSAPPRSTTRSTLVAPAAARPGGLEAGRRGDASAAVLAPTVATGLPESVYRRRRLVAVAVLAVVLTVLLAVGRPDEAPLDAVDPWPSQATGLIGADTSDGHDAYLVSLESSGEGAQRDEAFSDGHDAYAVSPDGTRRGIARSAESGRDPRSAVQAPAGRAGNPTRQPGQRLAVVAGSAEFGST